VLDNLTQVKLTVSYAYAAPIPEPESWAMLLAGMGLIGLRLRRTRVVR
jgi:hypothetical protein